MIESNPRPALALRLKRWFVLLFLAMGFDGALNAQLAVVNGSFTNLTGLTSEGGGWYGGVNIPTGWTAPYFSGGNDPYMVYNPSSGNYYFNMSTTGNLLAQTVGTVANDTPVILTFDSSTIFQGGTSLETIILDSSYNVLASGTFSPGLRQILVASNVSAGTTVQIYFEDTAGEVGLANVSVQSFGATTPPQITQQPAAVNYFRPPPDDQFTTAALSVSALGVLPLSYQWLSNGTPIAGATNAILAAGNSGSYTAVVTGGNSLSVTSTVAEVIQAPQLGVINGNFSDLTGMVAISGGWYGNAIPHEWISANGPFEYEVLNAGGGFTCNVDASGFLSQYMGKLTSADNVTLTFDNNSEFLANGANMLSVAILDSSSNVIAQTNCSTGLGQHLVASNVPAGTDLTIEFWSTENDPGLANVSFTSAIVTSPPVISVEPVGQTRWAGGTVTLTASVQGSPPPALQWRFNNFINVPGATNQTLTIADLQTVNAGSYVLKATNSAGSTNTTPVTLNVLPVFSQYTSTVLANNPMDYWRFNDGEATNAYDYVGNITVYDTNYAANGGSSPSTIGAGPQPPAFPGFESTNTAPFMDGATQGYASTVSLFNSLSNFTLMGWFNINPAQYPFTNSSGRVSLFGQEGAVELGFQGGNLLYFYSAGISRTIFVTNGFTAGQWNFVAVVSDTNAGATTVYLNGVAAGTASVCPGTINANLFSIGKNVASSPTNGHDNAFFPGSIDEVAAFGSALSPSVIQAIYQSSGYFTPSAAWTVGAPIVTYWGGPGWAADTGEVPQSDATATQLATGGWNLVSASLPSDLDAAQAHGLRAMWWGALDNTTVTGILNYPALTSYFVMDEPSTADFVSLASTVSNLHSLDPNRMAYINLQPTYATTADTGASTYTDYLNEYLGTVHPAMLSYDNYQFYTNADLEYYFQNLAIVNYTAQQAGIPFLNIIQACSFNSEVRIPTGNELQYLYYTSLAYGAAGVCDFVYYVPYAGYTGMMTDTNGVTTAQYSAAETINPPFVAVAQQVQSMVHVGAYHLGDLPPGLSGVNTTNGASPQRLPGNSPFTLSPAIANSTYVTSAPVRGAVLGLYGTNNQLTNATCVLVVNENYGTSLNTTVLGPGNLSVFNPATGLWTAQGQASAAVTVLPGGGVLVGLTASLPAQEGTQYATNGLVWGTASKWASSTGGPYAAPWTNGNNAVFTGNAGTISIAASGATAENLFFTNGTGDLIQNNILTLNGYTPTITVGSGITATISSAINGSVGITKAGLGTLTLSGVNTYGGGTTVNAGELQIASDSQLGAVPGSPTVNLALNGGQLFNNGGALTLNANRNISLGSLGGYIQSGWASALTIPGQISGYGGLGVAWGNGTVVLSGANSYMGATTIGTTGNAFSNNASANPTLQLANANALPETDLIFGASANNNTATLDLNGYNATVSALAGGGNAIVDIVSAGGTSTLTVGATNINSIFNGVSTFAGVIRNTTGAVALNIIGSGTITLSGANTYSGGTIVNGGTLVAQSSGALGAGNVTVAAGATLQLGGGAANSYISTQGKLLIQSGANPVNLAFTGSADHIAGLSFDGGATFQTNGTWGSSSSGAANKNNTYFSGTGTLLVGVPTTQPVITTVSLTAGGGSLVFSGTNGTPNSGFSVLTTTNLALPLASWSRITNGTYGSSGSFTVTNVVNPAAPHFYRLSTP